MRCEKCRTVLVCIEQTPFPTLHSFKVDVITIIVVHGEDILVTGARLYGETPAAVHEILVRALYPRIDWFVWVDSTLGKISVLMAIGAAVAGATAVSGLIGCFVDL